jgi:hypothetical protein
MPRWYRGLQGRPVSRAPDRHDRVSSLGWGGSPRARAAPPPSEVQHVRFVFVALLVQGVAAQRLVRVCVCVCVCVCGCVCIGRHGY